MAFTTKRGRPRKAKEIAKPKRVAHEQEALDILFKKSLITEEELWAGMHFRWLYTLKFGAPSISAAEMQHFYGRELKIEDPDWQAARGKDYSEAINELRNLKALKPVMNIAIFNMAKDYHRDYKLIIGGLGHLCKIWGKDNSRR